MPKTFSNLAIVFLTMALAGCNQKQDQTSGQAAHRITIGVSYQNLQNEFIINVQMAIRDEAKKLNVDLVLK